jgi:quercetin dioxygenase-like cupin family protein
MPVVRNDDVPEVPWRPGYQSFVLAGREQGLHCSSSLGILEPGAGAPLHIHTDADEIFIVMAGRLELRLGEERQVVGEGHTVSIPAGTPHAFTALGPEKVRFFAFLSRAGAIAGATTYLEGTPPQGADLK